MVMKTLIPIILLLANYLLFTAPGPCYTNQLQFALTFGDKVTAPYIIRVIRADTSGNIAFGGIGYKSSTIKNVGIVGYYAEAIHRVVWIRYIEDSTNLGTV